MSSFMAGLGLAGARIADALDGLTRRLSDMSPALDDAGGWMLASVRENFLAGGRPQAWQPLAPSTVRRKGHAAPLVDTGFLMSSVRFSAGPDRLEIYTPVSYARPQQSGTASIPARPFLMIHPGDEQAIKDMLVRYLSG